MIATEQTLENMTLTINQEIHVQAPLDVTFAALLEQLGPGNETPDGKPLSMTIEPWPGGRWYRDLGDGNGHFWANVQAIKRPSLLEFAGPLFASFPFVSNVQYRLSEVEGGTLITFRHSALGFVTDQQRADMNKGWGFMHEGVRKHAEGRGKLAVSGSR
jgi:Activator of Hsp90 ATPase homolog 1-like protein